MGRRWVALSVVLALVSGCLGASDASDGTGGGFLHRKGRASPVSGDIVVGSDATVELMSRQTTVIRFDGTGWARLNLVAREHVRINASVLHDSGDLFSEESLKRAFTEGNYTVIDIFHADEPPRHDGSFSFDVRGSSVPEPYANVSGHWNGTEPADPDYGASFEALPGTTSFLLVATSVPGFSLELTSGFEEPRQTFSLALHEHPDTMVVRPEPSTRIGEDLGVARVNYDRVWEAQEFEVPRSMLFLTARWATDDDSPATIWDSRSGNDGPPSTPLLAVQNPHVTMGAGSSNGGGTVTIFLEPRKAHPFFELLTTDAGVDAVPADAWFLVVPLD